MDDPCIYSQAMPGFAGEWGSSVTPVGAKRSPSLPHASMDWATLEGPHRPTGGAHAQRRDWRRCLGLGFGIGAGTRAISIAAAASSISPISWRPGRVWDPGPGTKAVFGKRSGNWLAMPE